MAEDLHKIGAISDARMQEHDKNCLVSTSKSDQEAPKLREAGLPTPATA
jgi:hypothetical protein